MNPAYYLSQKSINLTLQKLIPNLLPSTSSINQPQPFASSGLSANCHDSSHISVTYGATFNSSAYIKPASSVNCLYTDSILGYSFQYPANWYILVSPAHPNQPSNGFSVTFNGVTSNDGTAQPYNVITLTDPKLFSYNSNLSLNSKGSPPSGVGITILTQKSDYPSLDGYITSQKESYLKGGYTSLTVDGQKAIQFPFLNGLIDTVVIKDGLIYYLTLTLTGMDNKASTANMSYYTNFLNSFKFGSSISSKLVHATPTPALAASPIVIAETPLGSVAKANDFAIKVTKVVLNPPTTGDKPNPGMQYLEVDLSITFIGTQGNAAPPDEFVYQTASGLDLPQANISTSDNTFGIFSSPYYAKNVELSNREQLPFTKVLNPGENDSSGSLLYQIPQGDKGKLLWNPPSVGTPKLEVFDLW